MLLPVYASGMSPKDIEREIKHIDWTDVFIDEPNREDRSFRRKLDDNLYMVKPKLGFSDGEVKTPLAYIHGQKFDLQLSRLTLRAADIHDFNKLPIPFHAMATDIETGESVVLDRGRLAQAMRASMSVPGAIVPVEIDGWLLVDGGIANNLPINEARKLCGDVIIAVNISTPPLDMHINGTGLGLALVKRIVEGYQGTVSVESAISKGSRFQFRIPLASSTQTHYPA